jgi:hypothetical protein
VRGVPDRKPSLTQSKCRVGPRYVSAISTIFFDVILFSTLSALFFTGKFASVSFSFHRASARLRIIAPAPLRAVRAPDSGCAIFPGPAPACCDVAATAGGSAYSAPPR